MDLFVCIRVHSWPRLLSVIPSRNHKGAIEYTYGILTQRLSSSSAVRSRGRNERGGRRPAHVQHIPLRGPARENERPESISGDPEGRNALGLSDPDASDQAPSLPS